MKIKKKTLFALIDFILIQNFKLERRTESKPNIERTLLSKIYLNSLKKICQYSAYIILKYNFFLGNIHVEPLVYNDNNPIISITSFPARIQSLWMVIYCVFNQTKKPGKVILTLTKQEFPNEYDELPRNLNLFIGKGLEIHFVEDNLRPHNKYFYVLQQYPNRDVITLDDDLLYCSDTIERLYKLHNKYPDTVCSNRIQRISISNDIFDKYEKWETIYKPTKQSHSNLALGYGGVFYPQNFRNSLLFDADRIKKLCPLADDLWLKCIEIISDIKVVSGDYYAHPLMLPFSQKTALRFSNSERNRTGNDNQWDNLNTEFNLSKMLISEFEK